MINAWNFGSSCPKSRYWHHSKKAWKPRESKNPLSFDCWSFPFSQILLYLLLALPFSSHGCWKITILRTTTETSPPHGKNCFLITSSKKNKAAHQVTWSECVRHEDVSPLAVLVSVMCKSTSLGTPESIGEETVKSAMRGWADSVTESVLVA